MKTVKTKKEKVLTHLKKHGKITNREASARYGVSRLRDIVYTLRKEGVNIQAVKVERKKPTVGRSENKYILNK